MSGLNNTVSENGVGNKEGLLDKLTFILIAFTVCVIQLIIFPVDTTQVINNQIFLGVDIYYKAKTAAIYAVILLMLVITLVKLRTEKIKLKINAFLVMFISWTLISTLMSEHKETALFGWAGRWQGSLTYVAYLVIFIFVLNFLKADKLELVMRLMFISSAIVAVYAILQYYGLQPLKPVLGALIDEQIHSTIGNRNFLGSYMVLFSLTAAFLYINNSSSKGIYMCLLSVLYFAGLLASLTRVAWLGFVAAFLFCLWLKRGKLGSIYKKVVLLVIFFAVITVVLNQTSHGQIMARIFNMKTQIEDVMNGELHKAGTNRGYIYMRAFDVMLDKPVFGTGPDSLGYYTILTKEDNDKYFGGSNYFCIDKAHSEYLEYAATMGLPSLLLYLGFLSLLFIPAVRNKLINKRMYTGIFAGWIGYVLQAAFNIGVISVLPVFFTYSAIIEKALENKEYLQN